LKDSKVEEEEEDDEEEAEVVEAETNTLVILCSKASRKFI